jgi:small conductance mechanosensitive channel
MDESLQTLDRVSDAAMDLAIKFAPKLLVALLILAAGYLFGRWSGRMVAQALHRYHMEPPLRMLLQRIVHVLVIGLFLILALQNLGVELLPLIAGLGVAGAGVALAMQGVLGNVAAGLTIIFTRPFRVGEYISIVKEEGEVQEITLSTTTLGHSDLSRVVIPNRKIVGEILHNYGKIRQLAIEVGVSYDTDLDKATAAAREVLQANPLVLKDPVPAVRATRLADSCVIIGVAPWVNAPDYGAATGQINQAILEAFRRQRIEIPLPQREIRMVTAEAGLRGGAAEGAHLGAR